MLAGAIAAFLLVRACGEGLTAPAREGPAVHGAAAPHTDVFLHVLLALVAVIVAGRGLGWLFR
jgi:hypothetical protein